MISNDHDEWNDKRIQTLQESLIKTLKEDKNFMNDFFYKGYYEFRVEDCLENGSYEGYIVYRQSSKELRFEWVSLNDEYEIHEVLDDTWEYVHVTGVLLYSAVVLNNAFSIEETVSNEGFYLSSYYDGYEKRLNLFCPRVQGLFSWSKPKKDMAMGNACKALESYFKDKFPDVRAMLLHIHMSYSNDLVLDVEGATSLEDGMSIPLQSICFGTNPAIDKILKKIVDITDSNKYPLPVSEIYILLDDYYYGRSIESKVTYRNEDDELVVTVF